MTQLLLIYSFFWSFLLPFREECKTQDYKKYHLQINKAEEQIAQENFKEALELYDEVFQEYDFIFLADHKRAVQLAFYIEDLEKTEELLRNAIAAGWKSINKNKFLSDFRKTGRWKSIRKDYKNLREQYEERLNIPLKNRVKKMFSKDQRKAMGALFKFSSKAKDRYAEKKFAPHSRSQLIEFKEIITSFGFPGEQLIGNDIWMSTILSHHNSITKEHAETDTLYTSLKPLLFESLNSGHISPFELALIDDWYLTVRSGWSSSPGYGILNSPSKEALEEFDALRKEVYLRPITLRNRLVEIENKTGMDLYLPGEPWVNGKIDILTDKD